MDESQEPRVIIRPLSADDRDEFIALAQLSQKFLSPWIDPPTTIERFDDYIRTRSTPTDIGMVICEEISGRIAGIINVTCIVRGYFQSAYLGYWIGEPFANRGYMTKALRLTISHAFTDLKLHRLEANIQPGNVASIALVKKCGLKKEGYSPKYLKVLGEWRDHERWAIRLD